MLGLEVLRRGDPGAHRGHLLASLDAVYAAEGPRGAEPRWFEVVDPAVTPLLDVRGTAVRLTDVQGDACASVLLYNAFEPFEQAVLALADHPGQRDLRPGRAQGPYQWHDMGHVTQRGQPARQRSEQGPTRHRLDPRTRQRAQRDLDLPIPEDERKMWISAVNAYRIRFGARAPWVDEELIRINDALTRGGAQQAGGRLVALVQLRLLSVGQVELLGQAFHAVPDLGERLKK